MHGKGRTAQLLHVKKWTDYPAKWEKRRLSLVPSICEEGQQDPESRSLRITHWNWLGEQTNKEKKVTNGDRAVKNFHLKWVTVIHVRSHETQQSCNCIQNCLCSLETWNRTFSKRSKKLKISYQKSPCRVEICVTLLCSLQGQTE